METIDIARICHEANRAYCVTLGDQSQPSWDEAPDWQRSSAIAGVEFHLANPDAGPEGSHASWMRQKIADGWSYGVRKDTKGRFLVPYRQLPPEQQRKDALFVAIVHACK